MLSKLINVLKDLNNTIEGLMAGEECFPNTLYRYIQEVLSIVEKIENEEPITEEFLDKHFKRGYSTFNNHFEGWVLPWTSEENFDGFHICQGAEDFVIEDHCLMRFSTVGQLRLAFMMMGQDLDKFKA